MTERGPALSNDHYLIFGRIMVEFAELERLFKFVLSAIEEIPLPILNQDIEKIPPRKVFNKVSEGMNTAFSKEACDGLKVLLNRWVSHKEIRDSIAHHGWVHGIETGTVQPVRHTSKLVDGKLKFISVGATGDDKQFSIPGLMNILNDLIDIKRELRDLKAAYRIDEKIDRINTIVLD